MHPLSFVAVVKSSFENLQNRGHCKTRHRGDVTVREGTQCFPGAQPGDAYFAHSESDASKDVKVTTGSCFILWKAPERKQQQRQEVQFPRVGV